MTEHTAPPSVVIASFRSRSALEPALAALAPQVAAAGGELIVARRPTDPDEHWIRAGFPQCRLIACPADADVPQLRGAGLAVATGAWVALTEDNCVADDHWLEQLAAAMTATPGVVGGTMTNARTDRAIDWAAFFAEYGFFGAEPAAGQPSLVTGANVGYPRAVLAQVAAWAAAGMWEDVIHQRLRDAGVAITRAGNAVVAQQLRYSLSGFAHDRYWHGRDYARVRSAALGGFRRLGHVLATPLLPPLLTVRVWRATGQRTPWPFLRALPFTLAFLLAWSIGEAVGYCLGPHSS
jgi:hypothetical protein